MRITAYSGSVDLHSLLIAIITLLTVLAISTSLSRWLGLGTVLAMLGAGVVLGPFGFQITAEVDRLREFTELSVVVLMFSIGLEMEPKKLWSMRRLVFGLGTLQLLITAALLAGVFFLRDDQLPIGILAGLGLALSSTALGVQLLKERKEIDTPHGQATFAVLLLQDMAIVPLIALLPLLGGDTAHGAPLGVRLLQIVGVVAGILALGRWVLPLVLRHQHGFDNMKGFGALVFLAIFGSAFAAEWAGISMALGAFLVGMMLADSIFMPRISKLVHPLKHVMLDLFFIAVGMSIDLGLLANQGVRTAVTVVMIVIVKAGTLYLLGRWFSLGHGGSLRMAAMLSQAGEFGFVLFGSATAAGVISPYMFNIAILVIALSMTLTPFLLKAADRLAKRA
jgi:glutathione-regulated potassium-efflux system ancillary protein KefC